MGSSTFSKIVSFVFYLVLFTGIAFASYTYRKEIVFILRTNAWNLRPCSFTTTYSIGTFDKRFGKTKEEFLSDIETATALWDAPLNKRLFVYQESGGDITINLIYDKRQKTTNALAEVNSTISAGKREYETLKAKYTPLIRQYEEDKVTFNARVREYKIKTDSYNQKVAYWNTRGGAPKAEYESLAEEKIALDKEADILKQMESNLRAELPRINEMVTEMNNIIAKYNLSIKTYNTVGETIGKEFDEGLYEQTFNTRTISIYQFDNDNKLIRVLAHEFGHALGIDHIPDDEDAIMYYLNESTNDELTRSDINALKMVCGVK